MSIRILSTSPLVGNYIHNLGQRFPELVIASFNSDKWRASLATVEAMIVLLSEPIAESVLQLAPKLKVIGTYSVGVNHLPVKACTTKGISIVSTPGVLTDATADLALAMLLSLTRRLKDGEDLARSGSWTGWAPDQVLGTSLAGKTCGIIGSGAIGKAFARRVNALGMKPIFWARADMTPVDFGTGTAERLLLPELLKRSEVLSLHCPLTAETNRLLSKENLQLLPNGAVVINTARGGILDEDVAIQMLHGNFLGGVGLDVYAGEPNINKGWFTAPRTVILPHLGSATKETRAAMANLLCEGIISCLESVTE